MCLDHQNCPRVWAKITSLGQAWLSKMNLWSFELNLFKCVQFSQILDKNQNLLIESLYENWWLQTSDTIRLALAASSIHKAAATEYYCRGGAECRTQRASSRRKPCAHAAPLPHAAPRGVPPPLSRLWAQCQSMTKDKSVLESLWDFIRTIDYAKGWNFTSLPSLFPPYLQSMFS